MMMSVKSRIPQGRSKIPGFGASRLPHASNRKTSSRTSNVIHTETPPSVVTVDNSHGSLKSNGHLTDNYKLAFVGPFDSQQNFDENANDHLALTSDLSENTVFVNSIVQNSSLYEQSIGSPLQDFDDNFEVVSLCSAEPSPLKHCVENKQDYRNCDDLSNLQTFDVLRDKLLSSNAPHIQSDLVTLEHLHDSVGERSVASLNSSPCSSVTEVRCSGNKQVLTKQKRSLSKLNKPVSLKQPSKVASHKPPTTTTFLTECISGAGEKTYKSSHNRTIVKQKRIGLPHKVTSVISAANAMDYVKRITSHPSTDSKEATKTTRRRPAASSNEAFVKSDAVADYARPTRKISAPTRLSQSRRNNGKWSSDLDAAMNLNRRSSKPSIEEEMPSSSNVRSDRKKLYQETRSSSKPDVYRNQNNYGGIVESDATHDDHITHNGFSTNGQIGTDQKSKEQAKIANRSPKIARPVTRPPRRRHQQAGDTPESNKLEDDSVDESDHTQEEDMVLPSNHTRRSSVPASPVKTGFTTTRSRQRRRGSEAIHLHQHITSEISEESGYSTNTHTSVDSGDSLANDIARRKDRIRQNERYRDILENPEIVTFGHWRVKQEGNYAPEEKYGITERHRIRSSTDSDSVSPVRSLKPALSEESNTGDDRSHGHVNKSYNLSNHRGHTKVTDDDNSVTESVKSIPDTSHTDADEPSLSVFDDLPSLNSTAMMVDYSTHSNVSTPHNDEVHGPSPINPPNSHNIPNKAINELLNGGYNGVPDHLTSEVMSRSDIGFPRLHSSPLRHRAASDDINKFTEAAASGGNLAIKMDEMLNEYKIVRLALEQLQECLNTEEEQKSKMALENEKLRNKNNDLNEEINRLTRILEIKQSTPTRHAIAKHHSTRDVESQTDEATKIWYKTELSSVGIDLKDTMKQLEQVKKIKEEFSQSVEDAERKLHGLLKGIDQV